MSKNLLLTLVILFIAIFSGYGQSRYYINSAIGQPWGSSANITCMNQAFGVGTWNQGNYETVNVNALFQPTVCFIFMDGSDNNANALNNFLTANTVALQNWVYNGGKIYLNAAPNQGGNINFGFGGTMLNYPLYSMSGTAAPGMNLYPNFIGPANPVGTSFSGSYYAQGSITGGTVVTVMTGTMGQPILADRFYGLGHIFFGAETTTNWHSPAPNGSNLRVNILDFLGGCCGLSPSVTAVASPSSICAGQSVTITSSGAIGGTFNCFPGNLTGTSVVVSPSVSTNYNIILTPTAGCSGGATIRIIVGASAPTLAITGNTSICNGGTVNLTASGANTYTWSTGALTPTITDTPTASLVYSVAGTASTGCTGNASATVIVNANPTVSINSTGSVCAGSTVNLTASGANTYSWNNGALTASIVVSPSVNTTYSVIGTTSAGCTGTASQVIIALVGPTVSISGGTSAICPGTTVNLTANGANSYSWSTGANTSTVLLTPTVSTSYTVAGTSSVGCTGIAVQAVTVSPSPVITIAGSNTICAGQTATLTAGGANTYTWNNGSQTASIAVTPSASTVYSVTGTGTTVCTGAASQTLTVNANPTVSISGPLTVCSGTQINLTAQGASTYSWNTGAATATITPNPTVNTSYTVIGTSTAGCSGTAAVTVSVGNTPTVIISGTNSICPGQSITLVASGANSYLWNTGAFSSSIIVSPSVNTSYTANGTDASGCSGSGVFSVTVNTPSLSVSGGGTICAGQSATLSGSGAASYTWNTGSTNPTVAVSPTINTTYSVSGTIAAGCIGNTTVNITVLVCTTVDSQGSDKALVKIYPNPSHGDFNIEVSGIQNAAFEVADISGRIILDGNFEKDKVNIHLSGYSDGIYYLKILSKNAAEVFKLIKR